VEPIEQNLSQDINVVVVDGDLTNLNEPQVLRLNRSQSDPLTGRFGSFPLTEATVEVVVDSSQVVSFRETTPGRYQAPEGFRGEVGHSYQLRFTLSDGAKYQSLPEVMQAVPEVDRLYQEFNPSSLSGKQRLAGYYTAANDFYVDFQDPESQQNYYKWDWQLWERQQWCHTCIQGFYFINNQFDTTKLEDCVPSNEYIFKGFFINDYPCRTACWEILHNWELNLFDDQLSNGGSIRRRLVAQIPYYQPYGCLVELRQSSLTPKAYAFYRLQQQQSQNPGGLADAPPTALVGNIQNIANPREMVVGYFSVSAVASVRYWLDRQQNTGRTPGLFLALNGLLPSSEGLATDPNDGKPKPTLTSRPLPLAVCVESDTRTPKMPQGWRE
jgi:hypothetical protein